MRKIQKNKSPQWFEDWKDNFESIEGRKAEYKNDFPSNERRKLREALLEEQGYGYTYG